jgi:hypothetical protein
MISPISLLNPYSIYNQNAIIHTYYTQDTVMSIGTNPEYSVEDFFAYIPHMDNEYMDDGGQLRRLFDNYKTIADQEVHYSWFDTRWKFMMSLFIAHYMQITINWLKNVDNEMSITTTKQYASQGNLVGGKEMTVTIKRPSDAEMGQWAYTQYGRMYYDEYKKYAKIYLIGIY